MDWTLEKIRAKIRQLTGRPDEEALTTAKLDEYINHYYQNVFPLEALPSELEDWFTQNTADGTESYAVDEKYLTLKNPFTIAGWPINFYLDPKPFFEKFPETQTYTKKQPTDVLFFGQTLIFRPPPDGLYQFKAQTTLRPDALVNTNDKPPDQAWGPVIAYGSSIEIKIDNGEFEENSDLARMYEVYLTIAKRKKLIALGAQRSIPRF